MKRTECAACGGELLDFLNLGFSPLADTFPEDYTAREIWYPLEVAVCLSCWLAQLREVVPDEKLYGEDYGFRSAASPSAVRYFKGLAQDLIDEFPEQARQLTLEIACNDGTLLRNFKAAGCATLGVEPSAAADEAIDLGMIKSPFNLGLAENLDVEAGLILAFNVAAHVTDPVDFLKGISKLLAPNGVAVVEFQDFAALIAGCQFDHVYHEHRFFYSLTSFSRIAVQAGLEVFDWEHSDAQGGSIRVHLRHGDDRVEDNPWLESVAVYEGMQGRAEFAKTQLRRLVTDEIVQGRTIAGYGASAKSATLFNFCGLNSHQISWVEDLTPGKIGRWTPGSHIPIRKSDDYPDTYLLTSWNYLSSVLKKEADFLIKGKLIVPGAVPSLI